MWVVKKRFTNRHFLPVSRCVRTIGCSARRSTFFIVRVSARDSDLINDRFVHSADSRRTSREVREAPIGDPRKCSNVRGQALLNHLIGGHTAAFAESSSRAPSW